MSVHGITNPLIASTCGDIEALRALIAGGADINERHGGKTAVLAAILEGQAECLAALIEAGADLTQQYGRFSPAGLAIVSACHPCLVILMQAGVPAPRMDQIEDFFADYMDEIDRSALLMHLIEIGAWDKVQIMKAARAINTDTAKRVLAMLEAEDLGKAMADIKAAPATEPAIDI